MGQKKIRVGIIGTGFGAKVHAPIFDSHEGFEVIAISSVARKPSEQLQNNWNSVRFYSDWRKMIDQEQLDLVSIASAPALHHEMALYAMAKGAHILCEKPMALDHRETQEMLAAKDQYGKMAFVNFEWRFLPARLKVKEILNSKILGQLLQVRYQATRANYSALSSNKLGWLGNQELGGGMLGALGSHMFDSLIWWMDEKVDRLSAQLSISVPEISDDKGDVERRTADQSFRVQGVFESGTPFLVELVSGVLHRKHDWILEVYGTNGTLFMTDDEEVEMALGEAAFQPVTLTPAPKALKPLPNGVDRFYPAFYPMVHKVYQALTTNQEVSDLPLLDAGHQVQILLDAIRQSNLEGKQIQVKTLRSVSI